MFFAKGSLANQQVSWVSTQSAAAKSLQSCPTLCDPMDGSPPGSPSLGVCIYESQPPSLSLSPLFPLVTISLFSMSMGLFLFCNLKKKIYDH